MLIFSLTATLSMSPAFSVSEQANPKAKEMVVVSIPENARDLGNGVYDLGFKVILMTARYGDRCSGNTNEQYSRGYVELVNWLEKHGVKYDSCYMGKVAGALYVDDKAARVDEDTEKGWDFFWKELEEIKKKDRYGNYIDGN